MRTFISALLALGLVAASAGPPAAQTPSAQHAEEVAAPPEATPGSFKEVAVGTAIGLLLGIAFLAFAISTAEIE